MQNTKKLIIPFCLFVAIILMVAIYSIIKQFMKLLIEGQKKINYIGGDDEQYFLKHKLFMQTTYHTTLLRSHSKLFLIVFLIAISLCSCASPLISKTNHYFPVKNREQRASSLGFSIVPPSGINWFEKLNDNSLYYLKKIQTNDYSIYTKATEIHLDDQKLEAGNFLQYVKDGKKLTTASGDYRNVSFRYTQDKELSPLCIRYVQDYEDHGIKNLKKDEFIRVQKNGLVCMHPEAPENGVDMFYIESVRQSATQQDQTYKDEGEFFLSSLKFHPIGG